MTPKKFLLIYATLWKERYGSDYKISWSKETSQAKKILDRYGPVRAEALVNYYFRFCNDDFTRRTAHSLGLLLARCNQIEASLLEQERKQNASEHEDYAAIVAARVKLGEET